MTKIVRIAGLVSLILGSLCTTAHAQANWPGWYQEGIQWAAYPEGSNVGDCFGNCGAGCSDFANPCGGEAQGWSLAFVAGPDYVETFQYAECRPVGAIGAIYVITADRYAAIGEWTYTGWVALGCITHDFYCGPESLYIGCVMFAGCGEPQGTDTWSYQEYMLGEVTTAQQFVGYNLGGCGY